MKPNINTKASQSLMMMMMMNMFANNAICKLPLIYFFVVGENRKSQPSSGESRTLIILLITNDHPIDDYDDFEN